MNKITWNNVAAPNLGESNNLFTQAIQSLKDAGTGLKDTAKDYQTVVRNRNHGILQDYINSAKTPEELQSEAFNTGFKNLQATLASEYDPVKVNEYRDTRGDVLTKRAGDAVALERNTLGLTTDKKAIATQNAMNKILGSTGAAREQALADAKASDNYDAKVWQQYQIGDANLTQATNANDLFKVQKPFLEVQPDLANQSTRENTAASQARTRNAARELELKAQEIEIARQKAAKVGDTGTDEGSKLLEAYVSKGITNIRTAQKTALDGFTGKLTYADIAAADKAILKDEKFSWAGMPSSAKNIKRLMGANDGISLLPPKIQAAIYVDTLQRVRENNFFGKDDWFIQDDEEYNGFLQESIQAHTGSIRNAQQQEQVAIQDLAQQLSRVYGKPFEVAKRFVNAQLGVSPLNEITIDSNALEKIRKSFEKMAGAPNPKALMIQQRLKTEKLDALQRLSLENQLKSLSKKE